MYIIRVLYIYLQKFELLTPNWYAQRPATEIHRLKISLLLAPFWLAVNWLKLLSKHNYTRNKQ